MPVVAPSPNPGPSPPSAWECVQFPLGRKLAPVWEEMAQLAGHTASPCQTQAPGSDLGPMFLLEGSLASWLPTAWDPVGIGLGGDWIWRSFPFYGHGDHFQTKIGSHGLE